MRVNAWTINDNDQITQADEYRPLIVAYNKTTGAAVRLGDVATCRIRSKMPTSTACRMASAR